MHANQLTITASLLVLQELLKAFGLGSCAPLFWTEQLFDLKVNVCWCLLALRQIAPSKLSVFVYQFAASV